MTDQPTTAAQSKTVFVPNSTEAPWARFARLALIFVLAVYTIAVLGVLFLIGLDRVRDAMAPPVMLSTDDKASLALEQADRILSLLEVVIGAIALVLPLALGVVVFIFQQNRRTIEELTERAHHAQQDAAASAELVNKYRASAEATEARVSDALTQIAVAEERDRLRDEAARERERENLERDLERDAAAKQLQQQIIEQERENVRRDLARDEAARELQRQIADQKREVMEVSYTAKELLNQSRVAQDKLKKVDQFLEVRRHSALCTSEDVIEATTAVLTLTQIAQYPAPYDDDDDDAPHDPLRAERDMLLRREALRALALVREARHVPVEIRERLLVALKDIAAQADHKVLQLEARRTLRHLTDVRE